MGRPSPVHRISAELAELPPASPDAYVAAGFRLIASAVECTDGSATLNACAHPDAVADPLAGFRMMNLWLFGPRLIMKPQIVEMVMVNQDIILQDPVCQLIAREVGKNRLYHFDPRITPGFEKSIDAGVWNEQGVVDEIKVLHNISPDLEIMLGFHRLAGEAVFDAESEERLTMLNDTLGTWARRVVFLHGFGPGMIPLAPKEREALVLLLGPDQQKLFAETLDVSAARANEIVQSVHEKLGSSNRAELQRRWMSSAERLDTSMPVLSRARRRGAGPTAAK